MDFLIYINVNFRDLLYTRLNQSHDEMITNWVFAVLFVNKSFVERRKFDIFVTELLTIGKPGLQQLSL